MVQDHQKMSNELKALVYGGKVKAKLPTALDGEHQKLLDDLKAKNGKDFDQSYDQAQLKGHRDAVALFEAYAKGGGNAELNGRVGQTLPHLEEHGGKTALKLGRRTEAAGGRTGEWPRYRKALSPATFCPSTDT
jgi:predicted outer membrane protein